MREIKAGRTDPNSTSEVFTLDQLELKRTSLLGKLVQRATAPVVLAELLVLADGGDRRIADLGRVVISRIDPPAGARRHEIAMFICQGLENVRSHKLRIVLVALLGKFRDAHSLSVLQTAFVLHEDTQLRHAVIESLQNFGALADDFLLGELDDEANDLSIRQACLEALGVTSYRPAVPVLIGLLDSEPAPASWTPCAR